MNILRTCMLMEQIDMLHYLTEKLGHELPYHQMPFELSEEDKVKRKALMNDGFNYKDDYLLNWTRDFDIEAMLENRFLDEVDPADPADIHSPDGPDFINVRRLTVEGKFKKDHEIDNIGNDQRFSWAAVPYWCHGDNVYVTDNQLALAHWKDYDEDGDLYLYTIPGSPNKARGDILKLLEDVSGVNSYYIFIYSVDEDSPDRIDGFKEFKKIADASGPFGTRVDEFLKEVKHLLKDDRYEFILAQAISPEDDDDGDIAVHFLYRADK